MEGFQWPLPEVAKRYIRRCNWIFLFLIANGASAVFLGLSQIKLHQAVGPALIAIGIAGNLAVVGFTASMMRKTLRTQCRIDALGIHQMPGPSLPWSEVKRIDVSPGHVAGTKILKVGDQKERNLCSLVFDPLVIDESELTKFVTQHMNDFPSVA